MIAGFPDFAPGTVYRGPCLVVRGGTSDYVDDTGMAAFARLFPNHRLVTIPGASHWVHAEAPDAFLAAVTPFLAEKC
jgi:esterase